MPNSRAFYHQIAGRVVDWTQAMSMFSRRPPHDLYELAEILATGVLRLHVREALVVDSDVDPPAQNLSEPGSARHELIGSRRVFSLFQNLGGRSDALMTLRKYLQLTPIRAATLRSHAFRYTTIHPARRLRHASILAAAVDREQQLIRSFRAIRSVN